LQNSNYYSFAIVDGKKIYLYCFTDHGYFMNGKSLYKFVFKKKEYVSEITFIKNSFWLFIRNKWHLLIKGRQPEFSL
jgi:hypothetical protein